MGCDMVEVLDNKCPACGAKIEFNPLNQMWDCEYCYSKFTLEEMKAYKNASSDAANNIPVLEVKEEKKEKVNIMIQENKKLLNKIIIEIVDFCLMYNENNINIDDFSDYINKYNPNDFIITNNDERNIIIDRKEI